MSASSSSTRRVGAANSKTRPNILDAVERLMLDKGYAAVTYRALAAEAGVTPALVQYYFPTLDDVLVATIRRSLEGHVERLVAELQERSDEPLHVIWDFAREEATAALMIEYTALGHHRQSIKAEIAQVANKVRQVQLDAVSSMPEKFPPSMGELSPPALVFLLTAIPKLLRLEAGLGVSTVHAEVMDALECYLDDLEPRAPGSTPT